MTETIIMWTLAAVCVYLSLTLPDMGAALTCLGAATGFASWAADCTGRLIHSWTDKEDHE